MDSQACAPAFSCLLVSCFWPPLCCWETLLDELSRRHVCRDRRLHRALAHRHRLEHVDRCRESRLFGHRGLPIFLLIFGVPAVAAIVLKRKVL